MKVSNGVKGRNEDLIQGRVSLKVWIIDSVALFVNYFPLQHKRVHLLTLSFAALLYIVYVYSVTTAVRVIITCFIE